MEEEEKEEQGEVFRGRMKPKRRKIPDFCLRIYERTTSSLWINHTANLIWPPEWIYIQSSEVDVGKLLGHLHDDGPPMKPNAVAPNEPIAHHKAASKRAGAAMCYWNCY